jgi:protein-tyrosine phosphatase
MAESGERGGGGIGRAAFVVLSLGALAAILWFAAIKPNVAPDNFGVVVEGKLYRSADLTPAATRRVVEHHKIKTIIDLGAFDNDPELERVAQRTAEALGVERHVFRLYGDGRGNPNAYVAALRIMTDASKHPVLVHCAAGAQRTGACIMLYRNIVEGKSFESVVPESWKHRHDPGDNRVMLPWLLDWHDKIEKAYREGGYIAGQPDPEQPELGSKGRTIDGAAHPKP